MRGGLVVVVVAFLFLWFVGAGGEMRWRVNGERGGLLTPPRAIQEPTATRTANINNNERRRSRQSIRSTLFPSVRR